jgi:arylformamidase
MAHRDPRPRRTRTLLTLALALLALALLPSGAAAFSLRADLSYDLGSPPGDPDLNRLDLYLPDGGADGAPVVVYVHGGGWRTGDKGNGYLDKARLFTEAGYVYASLNYRLSPNPIDTSNPSRVRYPAHPHDVGEAIGWLRRHVGEYGGDPSRIVLVGHSAGAQIVSLVGTDPSFLRRYGTDPSAIRAVVSLDTAAYDITSRADNETSPLSLSGRALYWNAFATPAENASEGTWTAASPIEHADRRDPPFLLVTQRKSVLRQQESRAMAAALAQDPDRAVLAVSLDHAGINAALGDPDDKTAETDSVLAFVRKSLSTDAAPRTHLDRRPHRRLRLRHGARKAKARFRFSAKDERAEFRCRIDRRRWKHCRSPKVYRLRSGRHRFRVRSRTRNGKGPVRSFSFRVLPA